MLDDLARKTNAVATGVPPTDAPESSNDLGVLLSLGVSTAPLGTSTGGFTFTFDNSTGTFTRTSQSFGPAFGKRSLTIGKGKASAGFNWLHAGYDSLGGLNLANGDLRPVRDARAADGTPLPYFYSSVRLGLTTDTYVGFVTYGVSNDLDVGVAAPWVRVSLSADVGLFGPNDEDLSPPGHLLVLPHTTASGLGDIEVFGKYRVWHHGEGGMAAELKVTLPTGNTSDLRGTGVTRTLVSAIWSHGGKLSPHANVGYELWSNAVMLDATGNVFARNQVDYGFGVELQVHPQATILFDVVGRRLLHGGVLGYEAVSSPGSTLETLVDLPKGLDVVSFAPGVKWNVAGRVLVTANTLLSLANQGLRANVIPVIGVEWAF
jgi:hypothetical protein